MMLHPRIPFFILKAAVWVDKHMLLDLFKHEGQRLIAAVACAADNNSQLGGTMLCIESRQLFGVHIHLSIYTAHRLTFNR